MFNINIINLIESRIGKCQYQILDFKSLDNNIFQIIILLYDNGYIIKKIFIIEVIEPLYKIIIRSLTLLSDYDSKPYIMTLNGSNLYKLKESNLSVQGDFKIEHISDKNVNIISNSNPIENFMKNNTTFTEDSIILSVPENLMLTLKNTGSEMIILKILNYTSKIGSVIVIGNNLDNTKIEDLSFMYPYIDKSSFINKFNKITFDITDFSGLRSLFSDVDQNGNYRIKIPNELQLSFK